MNKEVMSSKKEQGDKSCLAPILKRMKQVTKVLVVFILLIVTLPLCAQEDTLYDSTKESQVDNTVVDSDNEAVDLANTDENSEEAEGSESSNLPLLLSFVSMVLSIVSIAIIYQQIKMEKKNNFADKLALLHTSIEEMKAEIDELKVEIDELKRKGNTPFRKAFTNPTSREEEVPKPITVYIQAEEPQPLPQEKKETLQTIYANGMNSGDKVTLKGVDARFETQATFVIEAKGKSGSYVVNAKAVTGLLNYISSAVNPYCDASIDSTTTPSRIETIEEGTVEKQGAFWVVTKKAKVKVT